MDLLSKHILTLRRGPGTEKIKKQPWPGGSGGWSVTPRGKAGLGSGRGALLGWGFRPWLGSAQEATD